jgi:mono/diheme cytochrome c family protein
MASQKRAFSYTIIGLGFSLLLGCGNYQDSKKTLSQPTPLGNADPSIDFATIKRVILDAHCISCHTGRHLSYANYAVFRLAAAESLRRVTANDSGYRMPKSPEAALSADKQELLSAWIAAGANEFAESQPDLSPKPAQISFAEIRRDLLVPFNCLGCHTNFNNYGTVRRLAPAIVGYLSTDQMPLPQKRGSPVTLVPQETKAKFSTWLQQGAPEFADQPAAPQQPEDPQPTWVYLRNNVLGPKCIICHNAYGPRAPTDMSTYKGLMAWSKKNPKLFDSTDPQNSHFVGSIIGRVDDDEFFFDPMPFNSAADDVTAVIPAVTPQELELIKQWIALGLPFNEDER